jgi:hypothetical protein
MVPSSPNGPCNTGNTTWTASTLPSVSTAASANCMDKHLTKMILSEAGVLVGPYVVVRDHEFWACHARNADRRSTAGRLHEYRVFQARCSLEDSISVLTPLMITHDISRDKPRTPGNCD